MFIALSVLLAGVCLVPGLAKLKAHPKMVAAAGHFAIPWGRYRLIGVLEVAAAAGALLGLLRTPFGLAAASGMAVLLVGALATHRRAGDSLKHAAPAVVSLAIAVAYLAVALTR